MDDIRQELETECDALKLSASIATEARTSELLSFVNDIVAKTGYADTLTVSCNTSHTLLFVIPHDINIESKARDGWNICISFHEDTTTYATARIRGIDYKDICSKTYDLNAYRIAIAVFVQVIDSLDALDDMLNNDIFLSYKNDIARYVDAKAKIKKHDKQTFDTHVKTIKNSFRPGMKIKTGNFKNARECTITKVCRKRLYVDNYRPYFGYPLKKTMQKDEAATNIANNEWSIINVE